MTPIIRLLSINLLLAGLGAVPLSLLRRALRFRAIALIEFAAFAFGYGAVAVSLAWLGFGVWALVVATVVQSGVVLVFAFFSTRHTLMPSLSLGTDSLLNYGARHSLISFLEFLGANLDTAVIGRMLGDSALGLYNRAFLLATLPIEKAANVVSRVLFPVPSSVQGDHRKVGSAFLLGILLVGFSAGVVSLGVAAAAETIVATLLGPKWIESVPVLEILALAVPVIYGSHIAGIVCDAVALLRFKLRLQACALLGIGVLIYLLLPYGVLGIAWAIVIVEFCRFALYLWFLSGFLGCRSADVLRTVMVIVFASALTYLAVRAASGLFDSLPPLGRLFVVAVAGAAAAAVGAVFGARVLANTEAVKVATALMPWLGRAFVALRVPAR